jgi:hypothetical protein
LLFKLYGCSVFGAVLIVYWTKRKVPLMSKLYKMKNELRSASEVTLTNYMTGSGGREDDNFSTSNLDVIGLTNLANSDLNLTNTSKEVIVSNSTTNTVFNNNNNNNNSNRTHSSLHQLHHLHHNHLHRPYERPTSFNAVNGNSTLSKYKSILSFTFT